MNDRARAEPIVKRVSFEGEDWLHFPAIRPDVAIIRATTADEKGNLTFEHRPYVAMNDHAYVDLGTITGASGSSAAIAQ